MKQVLIAVDQLVNTCVWAKHEGFGFADETLSARAHRLRHSPTWSGIRSSIDTMFGLFGDFEHCRKSWEAECKRSQYPNGGEYCKKFFKL